MTPLLFSSKCRIIYRLQHYATHKPQILLYSSAFCFFRPIYYTTVGLIWLGKRKRKINDTQNSELNAESGIDKSALVCYNVGTMKTEKNIKSKSLQELIGGIHPRIGFCDNKDCPNGVVKRDVWLVQLINPALKEWCEDCIAKDLDMIDKVILD